MFVKEKFVFKKVHAEDLLQKERVFKDQQKSESFI